MICVLMSMGQLGPSSNERQQHLAEPAPGAPRAGSGVPVQQLSPHWRNILNVFDGLLETLKAANVPQFLVKKLFQQLFSFVNVQLFNQLLLRRECCSFNNGAVPSPHP